MSHDRTLDHYGTEDTTTTVLSDPIGRYPAGTSLQDVLADLFGRLVALENRDCFGFSFKANAFIAYYVTANAVLKTTQTGGGVPFGITADASIGIGTFTFAFNGNAVLKSLASIGHTFSYTADGVIIDETEC